MYNFSIGAIMDSFRLNERKAIETAAKLGIKGLQMYATNGEHSPKNMTNSRCRELLDIMASNGLVFSALCGDFGKGYKNLERDTGTVEEIKRILYLAKELGTDVVTTHIGVIPEDPNHPRYKIMQETYGELAEYASTIGAKLAIETGAEKAAVLKGFLDSIGSSGSAVNFDPADLIMISNDDPVEAVYTLKDYIVHTHAKDGIKLKDVDPEVVYSIEESELRKEKYFIEVPLGMGKVPFAEYLKALSDIGYNGFLTIEREVGVNPAADIALAVEFLKSKIK